MPKSPTRPSGSVAVAKVDGRWAVREGATGGSIFPTRAEAVAAAKRALARQGGVLTVHQANGKVRETLTLGRDTAVRLNGIEGVALNTASRRLLRDVQASGLTPAQQLGAIVAAFKK